jgi:hypothetical protein
MTAELRDVTGRRGEKIAELRLMEYKAFDGPLFRPEFLGDKWPGIDCYVELEAVRGKRPYFFVQVKSTTSALNASSINLNISTKKKDIAMLLRIPGPTYILGVHEPTERVFIRSVHAGTPVKAITRIPVAHELTSTNLKALHNEVLAFWVAKGLKPKLSVFA